MRVLIDEDLDVSLRHYFPESVRAETVGYRGWKSIENGDLLRAAQHEYDVLVTMDKSIPHQQNLSALDLAVVILRAHSKKIDDLLELMPAAIEALSTLRPGEYREVFPPE